MIQDTSIQAYYEIVQSLNDRQIEVWQKLKEGNFTNTEIAHSLNKPINTITPRVYELREKGLVEEYYKRPCSITGRTAIAWKLKHDGIATQIAKEI